MVEKEREVDKIFILFIFSSIYDILNGDYIFGFGVDLIEDYFVS